jgi:hypothetical protein
MSRMNSRERAPWWVGGCAAAGAAIGFITALVLRPDALFVVGASVLGGVLGVLGASVLAQILVLLAGLLGLDEDGPRFQRLRAVIRKFDGMWDEVQP